MRLYDKTVLFHQQPAGEPLPSIVLDELVPVRARRRPASKHRFSNYRWCLRVVGRVETMESVPKSYGPCESLELFKV